MNVNSTTKREYKSPRLVEFGGLRELTLDQKTTPMPDDNRGQGVGGKT
jgi:hypothetical protein